MQTVKKIIHSTPLIFVLACAGGGLRAQDWNFNDQNNVAQGEIKLTTPDGQTLNFNTKESLATSNVVMVKGGGYDLEVGGSEGPASWINANKKCNSKGVGWRLPAHHELTHPVWKSISGGKRQHWVATSPFTSYSSTTYKEAVVFVPSSGVAGTLLLTDGENYRVFRCVRSVYQ